MFIHPGSTRNTGNPFARSSHQPGLLVSVRNWQEASIALEAGVNVLDLKEPFRGPLGAVADDETRNVIAGMHGNIDCYGRIPLSVALGELRDWSQPQKESDPLWFSKGLTPFGKSSKSLPLPKQIRFAKLGLAGMNQQTDWQSLWHHAMSEIGEHVGRVAVAYADHKLADSPDPGKILSFAAESGCQAFLIDTWDKSAGSLFRHLSKLEISAIVERAKAAGMGIALAGSLSLSDVPAVVHCKPDLIAIRSAACSGGRSGTICSMKIGEFKRHILANTLTIEQFSAELRQFESNSRFSTNSPTKPANDPI